MPVGAHSAPTPELLAGPGARRGRKVRSPHGGVPPICLRQRARWRPARGRGTAPASPARRTRHRQAGRGGPRLAAAAAQQLPLYCLILSVRFHHSLFHHSLFHCSLFCHIHPNQIHGQIDASSHPPGLPQSPVIYQFAKSKALVILYTCAHVSTLPTRPSRRVGVPCRAGQAAAHCRQPTWSRLSPTSVGLAHRRLASSLQRCRRRGQAGSRVAQASATQGLQAGNSLWPDTRAQNPLPPVLSARRTAPPAWLTPAPSPTCQSARPQSWHPSGWRL